MRSTSLTDKVSSLYVAHGRPKMNADQIAWQKQHDPHLPIAHPIACCALPNFKTVFLLDSRNYCIWTFDASTGK